MHPKVKRWKLAIQHYDCEIEYIQGMTNIMADPMSRLVASNKGYVALAIAACLIGISIDDEMNDLGEVEEHGLYVLRQNQFYYASFGSPRYQITY